MVIALSVRVICIKHMSRGIGKYQQRIVEAVKREGGKLDYYDLLRDTHPEAYSTEAFIQLIEDRRAEAVPFQWTPKALAELDITRRKKTAATAFRRAVKSLERRGMVELLRVHNNLGWIVSSDYKGSLSKERGWVTTVKALKQL